MEIAIITIFRSILRSRIRICWGSKELTFTSSGEHPTSISTEICDSVSRAF